MADLSQINVNGTIYDLMDNQARTQIAELLNSLTGGMHFIGEALQFASAGPVYIKTGSTTAVCYYTGTKPTATTIAIGGTTYTLTYKELTAGDVVINGQLEFIFSDADHTFHEFGSTGSLKALAFKDNASGTIKPKGVVTSTPVKSAKTLQHQVTQGTVNASGTYTPEGTIEKTADSTGSFVQSYPGSYSKLTTTTIHDTPTAKKTAPTKKQTAFVKSVTKSKLVTTTIKGVDGSTNASKASSNSFAGINASVSGETLILTTQNLTFSDVAVPIAQTAKTVATGSLATNGTGAQIVQSETTDNLNYVEDIQDDAGNSLNVVTEIEEGTSKTVATGSLSVNGTGGQVVVGLGTPAKANALTGTGNLTFKGKEKDVAVSGSTSGVAVANHSIQTVDSVNATFNGTEETITVQ